MNCLGEDLVLSFVQGKIPPGTEAEVQAHVAECSECRHLVAEAARYFAEDPSASSVPTEIHGAPPSAAVGEAVGRYQLHGVIGAGGMGVVYSAHDPQLNRKVAVKLVRASSNDEEVAARSRARLLREAQAMAQLAHPNVVAVFDAGTHQGQVFVAMEWVPGETLKKFLERRRSDWREVVQQFIAAGEGLAAAHHRGLVHRDFKPDNVLVGSDGRVRVTDFGLARLEAYADPEEGRAAPASSSVSVSSMTETGMLLGTPAYMAPEQLQGRAVDARSDQFSFCVALFEALYGRRPYLKTSIEMAALTLPTQPRLPASLIEVLERGLSFHPSARAASMDEVIAGLKEALLERPRKRAPLVAVAAAVLVAIAVAASFLFAPAPVPAEVEAPPAPATVERERAVEPAPVPAIEVDVASPVPAPGVAVRHKTARPRPAPKAKSEAPKADDALIDNPWGAK